MKRNADVLNDAGMSTATAATTTIRQQHIHQLLVHGTSQPQPTSSSTSLLLQQLSDDSTSVESRLSSLVSLSSKIRNGMTMITNQNRDTCIALCRRLRVERSSEIVNRIINLLSMLARHPCSDIIAVIHDLLSVFVRSDDGDGGQCGLHSHKVQAATATALGVLCTSRTWLHHQQHHRRMLIAVCERLQWLLASSDASVRVACLHSLSTVVPLLDKVNQNYSDDSVHSNGNGIGDSTSAFMEQLCAFTRDADARVRHITLLSLLRLLLEKRRCNGDTSYVRNGSGEKYAFYERAIVAMSDDDEDVRAEAMKLVFVLSQQGMLAEEEGFAKLCESMMDGSVRVRTQAASLLGGFRDVPGALLAQTLEKRLMSHGRMRQTAHERTAADAGMTPVNPDGDQVLDVSEVSLMSTGACGAFVHGFEDEFESVRSATVDTSCELASRDYAFGRLLVDFLVDMFNDEIDEVRANAVHSLRKIATDNVLLRETQLEVVLGVLEESSTAIRHGVHVLLGVVNLANITCLTATVHALLSNLVRFPGDRTSVWRCLASLGRRHASFAQFIVRSLFGVDSVFATTEPDADDLRYISVHVLAWNAAEASGGVTLPSLLPAHAARHRAYLSRKYPEFLPTATDATMSPIGTTADVSNDEAAILKNVEVLMRRSLLEQCDVTQCTAICELARNDLSRLIAIIPPVARPPLTVYSSVIECIAMMSRIRSLALEQCTSDEDGDEDPLAVLGGLVRRVLLLSYRVEALYMGLGNSVLLRLRYIRALVHAYWCTALLARSEGHDIGNGEDGEENCCKYSTISQISSLGTRLQSLAIFRSTFGFDETIDHSFMQSLSALLVIRSADTNDYGAMLSSLKPPIVDVPMRLRVPSAYLKLPASRPSRPLEFNWHIPLELSVTLALENVSDTSTIGLLLVFPDHATQLIVPSAAHWLHESRTRHFLSTHIHISQPAWSSSGIVEITPVLALSPDIPDEAMLFRCLPSDGRYDVGRFFTADEASPDSLSLASVAVGATRELYIHPVNGAGNMHK